MVYLQNNVTNIHNNLQISVITLERVVFHHLNGHIDAESPCKIAIIYRIIPFFNALCDDILCGLFYLGNTKKPI